MRARAQFDGLRVLRMCSSWSLAFLKHEPLLIALEDGCDAHAPCAWDSGLAAAALAVAT